MCTPRRLLTEALPGVHEAEEGWEILVKSQHSHLAFHSSPSKKKGSSREPGSVSVHSRKLTRLPPSRRPQGCRFGTSVQQDQLWPKAGLSAAMQAPSVFFLWTSIPSFVTAEAGALSARHVIINNIDTASYISVFGCPAAYESSPGHRSHPSHSCNLRHSCPTTTCLTRCVRAEDQTCVPVPQRCR